MTEFRHTNQTQGIGIGWNSINSVGTNANVDLNLYSKGISNVSIFNGSTNRAVFNNNGVYFPSTNTYTSISIPTTTTNLQGVLQIGNGRNGDGSSIIGGFTAGQLCFSYALGGFNHYIASRHVNSSNSQDNAIDFILNNSDTSTGSTREAFGLGAELDYLGTS